MRNSWLTVNRKQTKKLPALHRPNNVLSRKCYVVDDKEDDRFLIRAALAEVAGEINIVQARWLTFVGTDRNSRQPGCGTYYIEYENARVPGVVAHGG
ncbi:hypothetical protein [Dyadobacter sp. CY312]|uniref:hypothetical protein n=1 Tax=Dyadobacter sp. CY312 TaxID=2907303 RepID=UPI001F16AB48|nr:hypothetical protein [Dyadobacter sp. CY312]MCE7043339.1 hypothetical protein [Dyadobacter sp. CY312]